MKWTKGKLSNGRPTYTATSNGNVYSVSQTPDGEWRAVTYHEDGGPTRQLTSCPTFEQAREMCEERSA